MANRHRGEISAELGGKNHTLCLTLGALAGLEDAFGVSGLAALAARLDGNRLSARDLVAIIGAGLRGAGSTLDDAAVAGLTSPAGVPGYVRIVVGLLAATFGVEPEPSQPANPPEPQDA